MDLKIVELIIITIFFVICTVYAIVVTSLYNKKEKQATKYYNLWHATEEENVQRATTASYLREAIDTLRRQLAANERDKNALKSKLADANILVITWQERWQTANMKAEKYRARLECRLDAMKGKDKK